MLAAGQLAGQLAGQQGPFSALQRGGQPATANEACLLATRAHYVMTPLGAATSNGRN